jgi:hypothetical protein
LRKGHDLDRDPVPQPLAHAHHALDAGEPDLRVHIDMGADMRRAHPERLERLPLRLALRIDVALPAQAALGLDLVDEPGARLVGQPGHAPHGLVEMGVGLDETGQEQLAPTVEDRHLIRGGCAVPRHAPADHEHVGGRAAHSPHVADQEISMALPPR